MGRYKDCRECGIAIENVLLHAENIRKNSVNKEVSLTESFDAIESSCKTLCENRAGFFRSSDLVDVRENVTRLLEDGVNSKMQRELDSLKRKMEKLYKFVPFRYHGVFFGSFKLCALESFVIMGIAIVSIVISLIK